MARLNITIPDVLYTRLEQLRDRINLSKVCASALEKEVTMLEGQPNITDPRIALLLQRLQSTRDRWYRRGHDDGTQWAIETATREELWSVATGLAKLDGRQLVEFSRFPDSLDIHMHTPHPHVQAGFQGIPLPPKASVHTVSFSPHAVPFPPHAEVQSFFAPALQAAAFPASFPLKERLQYWENAERESSRGKSEEREPSARVEVDEAAYLEGWRDAVRDIWQAIAPALS